MTIHDKIERLTRFASKGAISRAAGLGYTTLNAIVARKSAVTTKTAIALARVLGVDAGWLMDDAKGWPPVRTEGADSEDAAAIGSAA